MPVPTFEGLLHLSMASSHFLSNPFIRPPLSSRDESEITTVGQENGTFGAVILLARHTVLLALNISFAKEQY